MAAEPTSRKEKMFEAEYMIEERRRARSTKRVYWSYELNEMNIVNMSYSLSES